MFGFWIIILFIVVPACAGAGIAHAFTPGDEPNLKAIAIGATIGACIGVVFGVFLVRI